MRTHRGAVGCLLLSLIGFGLAAYLSRVHIALLRGEFFGGAVCGAAGSAFDCHAVTASPFGSAFGVPLALWGLLGYLAVATLACIAWQFADWASPALACIVALSFVFLAFDLVLLVLMVTQIKLLCLLCLLTYLVNLLLLTIAKAGLAKPWREIVRQLTPAFAAFLPRPHVAVVWVFWGVLLVGGAGVWAVNETAVFMSQGPSGSLRKQMTQFVQHQRRVQLATTGDPIHGSPTSTIQIIEFSDFLCPVCQRASKFNAIILAGRRSEAAFTFKHFPLDQACNETIKRAVHPNACQIAAATECAHEQGKFWPLHDRIFEHTPPYDVAHLEQDAASVGVDLTAFRACLSSGRGLEAVKQDIAQAAQLGVTSTPTYVINGVVIAGSLTPAMFEELLRAIRHAGSS